MENEFKIDEGHFFDKEETIQRFLWKINDLKEEGWSYKEILNFEEHELWRKCVDKFLNKEKYVLNYKA